MCSVPDNVLRSEDEQSLQAMRPAPVATGPKVMPAQMGWQCPACKSVFAPHVDSCRPCDQSKHPKVPLHVIAAVEKEIRLAIGSSPHPQHVTMSGVFSLHYINRLLDAVRPK